MGVESLDLERDSDLSPLATPKGESLAKRASHLPSGALSEGGGADPFPCDGRERVGDERLLTVAFQGRHRVRGLWAPVLSPSCEPFMSLGCILG